MKLVTGPEEASLKQSFRKAISFVSLLWIVQITQSLLGLDLHRFGILPRDPSGLPGIFLIPFLHGDYLHLFSNTPPVIFLGTAIFYMFGSPARIMLLFMYLGGGLAVWLFARPVYHIGASGIIYSLVAFFFVSGVLRRQPRPIALALIVVFLYGGLVWGVLPLKPGVSWEGHLYGALAGIAAAIVYRKVPILKDAADKNDFDEDFDESEDPNNWEEQDQ